MKCFVSLSVLLCLSLFTGTLLAQEWMVNLKERDSVMNPALSGLALLKFQTCEASFDTISQDDNPVVSKFRFTNVSNSPVSISRIATTCGCTVVQCATKSLLPGAEDEIAVVFNPFDQIGPVSKAIFVYTDGCASLPEARLLVRGVVMPSAKPWIADYPYPIGKVMRLKQPEICFRDMKRQQRRSEYLMCFNSGDKPLTLFAENLPNYVHITTNPYVVEPGGEADVVVTIDGWLLPETIADTVFFPVVIQEDDNEREECILQVKILLN